MTMSASFVEDETTPENFLKSASLVTTTSSVVNRLLLSEKRVVFGDVYAEFELPVEAKKFYEKFVKRSKNSNKRLT